MRMKHRFGFNTDEKAVIRFLDKHEIKYDKDEIVTVFEIFEDDEKFYLINNFMISHDATDILTAVYNCEEFENAQWLTVRSSWMTQYPQPQDSYIFTTYDPKDYCEGNPLIEKYDARGRYLHSCTEDGKPAFICGKGLVQKECFIMQKEPNWSSRNFMMLNWIWDELFISRKAEEVLKSSDLKGFEIYDVLSKSKKRFEDTKQIFVKTYLSKGFCDDAIKTRYVCPKCGFVKYIAKVGANIFHKEIFNGVQEDIVKTSDKFGELGCTSLILITHKFYDVIKNAKLDRGLVFEPVELI